MVDATTNRLPQTSQSSKSGHSRRVQHWILTLKLLQPPCIPELHSHFETRNRKLETLPRDFSTDLFSPMFR